MSINNNKGIALVITLLVLALLMVVILEFNSSMRVEARAAANFRDDMKAHYLARSGITFAIALLEEDKTEDDKKPPGSRYDSLSELWAQKIPPLPVGDGLVSVEITDESSKINVNKLTGGFGTVTKSIMREWLVRFLEPFALKGELVDTITDWIDQDERGDYENLEEPFQAKNRLIDSLQELRLIKGIEGDIYDSLKNFLTVYPLDGRVNVNTASKEVLMSLSDEMSEELVNAIIAERSENPFQKVQDVGDKVTFPREGLSGEISKFISVTSNYFSITSTGEVNQNRKTINAIIDRSGNKTKILYWRVE